MNGAQRIFFGLPSATDSSALFYTKKRPNTGQIIIQLDNPCKNEIIMPNNNLSYYPLNILECYPNKKVTRVLSL